MGLVEQLVEELGMRDKAVSSTPNFQPAHGRGGLFSWPGLEPQLVNAMVLPGMGLWDLLPSRVNQYTDPLYGIVTGVTAGSGSNPTGVCDDFPQSGLLKLCTHTAVYGRVGLNSRVIDITRVGKLTNRGETEGLTIIGGPEMNGNLPTMPAGATQQGAANDELQKAFFEMSVEFARRYADLIYQGNPTNNTSGGGYKEPWGLDTLINTGYRDAITGVACPAADSLVVNWSDQNISSTSTAFVARIVAMHRYLTDRAQRTGMNPATWAIVMDSSLFYEVSAIWPCAYYTGLCGAASAAQPVMASAADLINLRDSMRRDNFLLIDGERVRVVFDSAVRREQTGGGTFESDIYFVPLTVRGNFNATYLEYFDYAQAGAIEAARALAPDGSYVPTNGGRYLWHKKPPTNYCVQVEVVSEWRLVLRTPYLAGRLANVRWTPLIPTVDWEPSAPSYYLNGGQTSQDWYAPSWYSPTA